MSKTSDIQSVDAQHVLQTYKRMPVALVRGNGARLYDAEGREYIDFLSGIGVAVLGHAHPGLADALADQARTLVHTSNLFHHPLQGQLAAKLAEMSGLSRAFICNSGTEAVEACLKFARRYWYTQGATERTEFVALEKSFAGRTMGALSVTWDDHYRAPFQPLIPGVTFVSPKDPAALKKAVTSKTAAIIVEPIQGEGGVRPISPEFAAAIEEACASTGALLIADEIQCGLGRTGEAFVYPSLGLTPDLMSVAKALGGGFPIGAALLSDKVATVMALWRSRHDLRRQSARLPRGALRARSADYRRCHLPRPHRRRALREGLARDCRPSPRRGDRDPRQGIDVGIGSGARRDAGRAARAPAGTGDQPHVGDRRAHAATLRDYRG